MILINRPTVQEGQVAGEYHDLRLLFSGIIACCVDVRHIAIDMSSVCTNARDFVVGRLRDLISKAFETDERDGLLIVYLLQTKVLTQRLIYNASRLPVYSTLDTFQTVSIPFAVILSSVRDRTFGSFAL